MATVFPYGGELAATASAFSYAIAVMFFRLATLRVGTLSLVVLANTAALVLYAVALLCMPNTAIPTLPAEAWFRVAVSGVLGIAVGDILYMAALKRLGALLQAVVSCLYAPFVMLLAYVMFGESLSVMGFLGSALILVSILSLPLTSSEREYFKKGEHMWLGLGYGALSMFSNALAVLMIRDTYRVESLMGVVAGRYLVGVVFLIGLSAMRLPLGQVFGLFRLPSVAKLVLPGAFFGQFGSVVLWFIGFKLTLAGKAAVLNQLSSLFIFLLAVIFLRETLTRQRALAMALGLAGAVVVTLF